MMQKNRIDQALKKYNLRNTNCRVEILSLFISKDEAMSHADVEDFLSKDFDRVTLYRTLKTFLDKGLLHKVLDDSGGLKYALCKECTEENHHHDHVHFKCVKCNKTTCIDHVEVPHFQLPKGYQSHELNLLVQGVCPECSKIY